MYQTTAASRMDTARNTPLFLVPLPDMTSCGVNCAGATQGVTPAAAQRRCGGGGT